MKLRKLISGIVVGALMAISLGTMALAAKSPATDTTPKDPTPAEYAAGVSGPVIKLDGVEVSLPATFTALPEATIASAKSAATQLVGAGATLLKAFECTPDPKFGTDYKESITVRFDCAAVKAGADITVLHQKADGSWEAIKPDSIEDGKLIATFPSLSPVAFAVKGTSDKTGTTAPVLPIVGALCIVGLAFCATKRFA